MNYSAITNLVNYIQTATTAYSAATLTFGVGENYDYSVTGNDSYPRLFVELPFSIDYTQNSVTYNFSIIIMDKTLHERTDEIDKLTSTFEIINHFVQKIKDDRVYTLVPEFNLLSLTEYGDDLTAGWRAELKLLEKIPVNRCALPFL